MAKAWSDYLPDILPDVPGCPGVLAEHAVRRAAIELCNQCLVWQEDLDKHHLVAGDPLIDLDLPAGSEIVRIMSVSFYAPGTTTATEIAGPLDESALNRLRPGWKDEASTGSVNTVDACTMILPAQLRVIPKPVVSQNDALLIHVALRPTRDSASGPDLLYTDYIDAIVAGAQSILLMQRAKPWSDPEMAAVRRAEFNALKASANGRRLTASGAASMSVYPRTLV